MSLQKIVILSGIALLPFYSDAQVRKPAKPAIPTKKSTVVVTNAVVASTALSNHADSLSYGFGLLIAQNLKAQGLNSLNSKLVAKAIDDIMLGQNPVCSVDQANNVVQRHMMKLQETKMAEKLKDYLPNKLAGEKFLADNKSKAGVVILPSGLQYQIMTPGTGPKPLASDKVKVHYHGTLISGEVFDSSVQRGEPATFGVTQVIQGWIEALQLMPVGSKWKLFIPQELAYSTSDRGSIKPYSALVFEVELISIEK